MMMLVGVEALNLRSEAAVTTPESRIAVLHLGQSVETLSAPKEGWVAVRVRLGSEERDGFVKAEFLRKPLSPGREALLEQAIKEWLRFEKGLGKETVDPYFRYVGEMWQAIGQDLDGKDSDVPWSAAAISFMVRNAAAKAPIYAKFRFAAAHSRYIHDAIKRRLANDATAPFWGCRLHESRPLLGDLVCRWRETPRTFDDAIGDDGFKSHCDIVVRVTPDTVDAIGGNVNNSVSITTYQVTQSGFLADRDQVFAHLVNRA